MKHKKNIRRKALQGIFSIGAVVLVMNTCTPAQNYVPPFTETLQQINGPADISETSKWQKEIDYWRRVEKAKLEYRDLHYQPAEIQWIRDNFFQAQMMVHERSFYDITNRKYTVDKYLDEITARYGGLNSILIWPTYPNIGIDDRNQFDWFRCMPGGLDGLKEMVRQFHRRGVKVLLPYNPWDIGTRREGMSDAETFATILKHIDADGINGDVTTGLGAHWRELFDKAKKGMVIEPELDNDDKYLEFDQMGWGYWEYPFIPAISKWKWIEPRHMVHVCDRWAHNHTNNLQSAFFNGTGFETWENIWGIYNEMTPRAAMTVKIISGIYKKFYKHLTGQMWTPHYPMLNYGVFASRWQSEGSTIWTIVNRNDYSVNGSQMRIPVRQDVKYYDLWNGKVLEPVIEKDEAVLAFDIDRNGYAAIAEVMSSDDNKEFQSFLSAMQSMTKQRLSEYSNEWSPVPQEIVSIPPTAPAEYAPEGMILIPAGRYTMHVSGIEIEGGENPGVDVQMPGETAARRHHIYSADIRSFYMDEFPVTNAQFKKFLDASHYIPADTNNFLKDWHNGMYPAGWDNKPVTWIDIEDARAYAAWAGKRLPHEWEWQYAAQGTDNRLYPWGNQWNDSAVPKTCTENKMCGPDDVDSHPLGRSPFGIADMVGNVWQWTDEYTDSHTRAAILRGGTYYRPQGSFWYFPQAYRLDEHGKYLLMSPGYNRSGAVGFRCVRDAK